MFRQKTLLICFILLCFNIVTFGQEWISLNGGSKGLSPVCKVISSNEKETIIQIELKGFMKETVKVENEEYQKLKLPGYATTASIGMPELPIITELIGIPDTKQATITITNIETTNFKDFNIYPYQTPVDEGFQPKAFDKNMSYYKSNENFPKEQVKVSKPMIWRNIRNVNMIVTPFMYNPATKTLTVNTKLTISVKYSDEDEKIIYFNKTKITSKQKSMYKNLIINYDYLNVEDNTKKRSGGDEYNMLIITPEKYQNEISSFMMWKNRKGLKTKLVTLSETGSTPTEIKDYITDEFNDNDIEYVLLVGSHAEIPTFEWGVWPIYASSHMWSDYWYGCVSPGGDTDYEAEVEVGRFSVGNSTELKNIVTKTINYESNPPVSDWVERSLLIAHRQGAPGKYQQCKEEVENGTDTDAGGTYSTMFPTFDLAYGAHSADGGNDATNSTITNAINAGRGVINYRGHGFMEGWDAGWSYEGDAFDYNETVGLTNSTMQPIVFSIACWTGNITHTDNGGGTCTASHSEVFTNISNGAVAYLGATLGSPTTQNHTFDKQLYNYAFDVGTQNLGNVITEAKIRTMTLHPDATSSGYPHNNATRIAKIYLLCGDPSLEIWTDTPTQFTNVSITETGTSVTVNTGGVTDCNIIVCSMDYGETYFETAENVSSHTFTGVSKPYYVTVTKHNYVPYKYPTDVYVQNQTLANDCYISGRNIYVGYDVTNSISNGNVTIKNGANILFDAEQNFEIKNGFECELGGTFEVIKK